ncbi:MULTISPECIES: Holliday junction resolvase RuvX [Companilactobacillus]|jgi:putative Holliday junction resolvase|uniref:Putative pre-16S rRNA nuclease n=1 Tax=Companilactobacillus pabuli TaxID=2714036 RepID=A0A7L7KXG8_9LACO|nr:MULTISPECIES: Holliday junction resolvase RuvX [Companilactobacillus]AKP02307.1 Holliday junction resolvase [Companilactobacillus farciminis]AKS50603.1 Holliday junction resolvase [Companilactobacillus farciminis]MDG5113707.1 Holliday junction resolvase RuvX [Companilactobacillus pabuli]QMT84481.1 Holliday junction resolvase RuvX [Companilactobacillus pabuli]GAQ01391.1 Holliday junction resolvase [Companilactobacillus farciminis]
MRLLGLDVGSRTVGVACSDLLGWTAQGVEIIRINEDKEEFGLDRLGEIIKEKQPTGIVLGLPKNMNNTEGPRVEKSREYGKMVEDRFHLPIDFIDERLTTVQAERMLIDEADVSRKKRKKVIDKIAAEMILQNYLDAKGKLTRN